MTVVLGMTELWKMSQSPRRPPLSRQWVERIAAAAHRLAHTVERMLKLVRGGDFSQPIDSQTIELDSSSNHGRRALAVSRRRQQSVAIDFGEPRAVEADPFKMSDVLINLLANAVKFTPDGGTIRLDVRSTA